MDLVTVRAFVTVADLGSVTAAADELRIAQPSLSRRLQRFERDLGFTLFDRTDRRLVLSPTGRRFLPTARDLLAREALAQDVAASLREGALGVVVLSAPSTTLSDVVAPFLATWDREDPLPHVRAEPAGEQYEALERGTDLAIGTVPPPPRLAGLHVARLPVWAYVPVGHPAASRGRMTVTELLDHHVLTLARPQHARLALDQAVAACDQGLHRVVEFSSPEVAQAVAAAGRGVAVVSDDPRFDLVPLRLAGPGGEVAIDLHAAWSPTHSARDLLQGIALRLHAFCRRRYPLRTTEPT